MAEQGKGKKEMEEEWKRAERDYASGRDFIATFQEGKKLNPGLSCLVQATHPLSMRDCYG